MNTIICQPLRQNIAGKIIDKDSGVPLLGVSVILFDSTSLVGTVSDSEGIFELKNIPIGRQSLIFNYLGYEELILQEILVSSSREVFLSVQMVESLYILDELIVRPRFSKDLPINNMTLLGARSFTVEETARYPISLDDPLRMAMNYAGVSLTGSDINNEIVIRGNSPQLMSWQVEGVQVFNPNHFSDEISSGGAVNILNNNILDNSDFLLSAWPAEYGNAISGIFDIHLRDGNNKEPAYAFQAGILGLDFTAEGPFKKDYGGSYLVNYRYSTLALYDALNIESDDRQTKYQDGAFKFTLPGKNLGDFSVWGFGGTSSQARIKEKSEYRWKIYNGSAGINHSYHFNNHGSMNSSLSYSGRQLLETKIAEIYPDSIGEDRRNDFSRNMVQLTSHYKTKFNNRHTLKTGFNFQRIYYDALKTKFNVEERAQVPFIDSNGHMDLTQLFIESKHNVGSNLILSPGLHFPYLFYNNTFSVEPRFAIKWLLPYNQSLGFGYGLHSQTQSLWVYEVDFNFLKQDSLCSSLQFTNKDLEFSKAHHMVLSYDNLLAENLHLRIELYYQDKFNVPIINHMYYMDCTSGIEKQALGNYSLYNDLEVFDNLLPLENKGKGKNYGIEFTLEKFLSQGWYFLLTGSLFDAKYQGINGFTRNSRYNGNYLFNVVWGKEFNIKKNRIFGINLRYFVSGGQRYTPVIWEPYLDENGDHIQNPDNGNYLYIPAYDWDNTYAEKFKDYIRADIGLKYLINRKKVSHLFIFDIQNIFNRQNILFERISDFDYEAQTYNFEHQYGRLPVFKYRIEF